MTIDPRLQDATRRLPAVNIENPVARRIGAFVSAHLPGRKVPGVARSTVRANGVRLRVYRPDAPSGAGLLWIHGGGLVLGGAAMDDTFCGETARLLGVTIVSVEYRRAPRHPFPAAIDDVHAGWRWLVAQASADGGVEQASTHAAGAGLDRSRLAVGGQSAGGGLAAALVQRLRDERQPVAAQWLFCPMLDDRTATDHALDAADHPVWNNRFNRVGWTAYLGDAVGAAELPPYAAAARAADLRGLPPTWIYASDIELFFDEDAVYARRLRRAGVDTTFVEVGGAPHGFEAWASDTEPARELLAEARSWLGEQLS